LFLNNRQDQLEIAVNDREDAPRLGHPDAFWVEEEEAILIKFPDRLSYSHILSEFYFSLFRLLRNTGHISHTGRTKLKDTRMMVLDSRDLLLNVPIIPGLIDRSNRTIFPMELREGKSLVCFKHLLIGADMEFRDRDLTSSAYFGGNYREEYALYRDFIFSSVGVNPIGRCCDSAKKGETLFLLSTTFSKKVSVLRNSARLVSAYHDSIRFIDHQVVSPLTLAAIIAMFKDVKIFIGIPGEEMVHLMWLCPGSHVVLLAPPSLRGQASYYSNLAGECF